ncbi:MULTISPECIES: helicase-exonuclease AddAB subunit AddB [unclassified Sedimentibacter]|uniref:helicase-exonuclease AddAB subunit AddB n=1 Tax=unclassified Sedimentibacter TaxID=2649220 RepID=UPI0027DEFCED|nr:helicase-exonuclease AddAB subunit AddB [Sedimentibacter sp. MB35-C1]WMJ78946.1 helicase-exonuclease AddAB subunit AddB [Sedimentibacter sp. MB35-C1]
MGLTIIAGRAKTGKSKYISDDINNEILKKNHNHLLLIVPEQMTYQAEYDVIERTGSNGIMSAEVLSFTRLGYKILEEVGGLKMQEINDYGKIMLLKQVFEENKDDLKLFRTASKQEGFLREFNSLISEMKQNCISVEFLEKIIKYKVNDNENRLLNKKLEDIIKVYGEIIKRTNNIFFDEEDKLNLVIEAVEKSDYIKNSVIWIDGFESFSMQRHRLIKKLAESSINVTITLNAESKTLISPHSTEDWEAFKIVCDTYRILSEGLDDSINLISLSSSRIKNEIKTIEQNLFSVSPSKFIQGTGAIQIFSSLNPYSETERVAQKIVSLVRDDGYRWKDIAIAASDMDSYSVNVKKVFAKYEIPYFLDYKRDIMGNPLTKFILSLFDMLIYNFRHDSTFEFLKTGFSDLNYDEVSRLENFALQYGIKGDKWFKPFKFNADGIEYFNLLRKKFVNGLVAYKKKLKDLKTTADITVFMLDFLREYKVQEKIERQVEIFKKSGQFELSGENAQVWNYVIDIFEQIVLVGGDTEISPREYKKMIETGFSEVKISIIPPTLDKVTVGEIEKISLKSSKVLFILGANEGKLDSRNNEKGLLLDYEREFLEKSGMKLLNDSDYYVYKEKHTIYKLFTNASDRLYLSWALGNAEGRTMQPSMYADKLRQIFPAVKEQTDLSGMSQWERISNRSGTVDYLISNMRDFVEGNNIDVVWKDVYSWYEANEEIVIDLIHKGLSYKNSTENINKNSLKKIHENPVLMSVSKIENFAACPFKFFMDNVIRPQPRLVQKIEFYDLGNIYHQSVEQFTKSISSELENIDKLDKGKIHTMSQECTEKILQGGAMDYTAFDSNERNRYMKEKVKRLVNRAAKTIVEQLKKGKFRPTYTELVIGDRHMEIRIDPVEIKLTNNTSIFLQGRIDRVDILKKNDKVYINVIDYKSSYKDIDLSDAVQGLQLQLLIYMSAVIKNGKKLFETAPEIGGAYYFCIDDPMIDGDEVLSSESENEIFKKLSLKGYIVEDMDVILNMDSDVEAVRKSDVVPVSLNKDGSTSRFSKTLTYKEFKAILNKADEVAGEIAEKIMDGNIDIMPYRKDSGSKTPCQYCEFKSVCQFDPAVDGNNYRRIKKLRKEEILSEILKKGCEDE